MKRMVIALVAFFLLTILFVAPPQAVYAAEAPYYNETYQKYLEALQLVGDNGGIVKETTIQTDVSDNMKAAMALSMGTTDPGHVFYYKNSALAQMGGAIAFMYGNPPANTYAFVEDLGQSLGFIPKKAYAADGQGSGYKGLLPILPIWKAFRNIAYGLLAVAMIVIGFMVMFRKKIDPKTVMTVQNSLPRIIVILLLISFSYAIAGFLIDLMYVLIIIGIEVLDKSGMKYMDADYLQTQYLNGGLLALGAGIFGPWTNYIGTNFNSIASAFVSGTFLSIWDTIIQRGAAFILGALGTLWSFIIVFAYVFVFIRILITLFSCYIQILMDVIFAPLQLLIDIFPGSNQTANWFKHIISNLLAFPITIFMLVLGDAISKNFGAGLMWQPPLLNTGSGAVGNLGQILIWFGILSTIPTIIRGLKEALKAKGLQGGVGTFTAPFAQAGGAVMGPLQAYYYARPLTEGIAKIIKPGKGDKP